MKTEKEIRDLGTQNGWNECDWEENLPLIKACNEAGHERERRTPYNCYNVTTCYECGIRWSVDSSG